MAKDARKLPRKVAKGLVHIRVAYAARMHLHQNLTWSGLRFRNIFDFPGTAHGRHNRGFHTFPSQSSSMRGAFADGACGWILDGRLRTEAEVDGQLTNG